MPCYYFNILDHVLIEDDEGTELAGIEEARNVAVIFAGEFLRDNSQLIWDSGHLSIEVRDESKVVVLRVSIGAEIPPTG